MRIKLSILISSLVGREDYLNRMLWLIQQQYSPHIEVVVCIDNKNMSNGNKRNLLVEQARGEYLCFVDDDDIIPLYYVSKILSALENDVDYVGFRMQLYMGDLNNPTKPTYHSLNYDKWIDDDPSGYYRDISHLNPMRSSIAKQFKYNDETWLDDVGWVNKVRAGGLVKTEKYIKDIMYQYIFRKDKNSKLNNWENKKIIIPIRHALPPREFGLDHPKYSYMPIFDILKSRLYSVLEFGVGDGSTYYFLENNIQVCSVESDNKWLSLFNRGQECYFAPENTMGEILNKELSGRLFDMIFVDGAVNSRASALSHAFGRGIFIVAHDTETGYYKYNTVKIPAGYKIFTMKNSPAWTTLYTNLLNIPEIMEIEKLCS